METFRLCAVLVALVVISVLLFKQRPPPGPPSI